MGVKILNKKEVDNRSVPVSKAYINQVYNTVPWTVCFIMMIIFWALFISILLIISYCPPPESGKETISLLCEGLKFMTYTLTGIVFGYPVGSATIRKELVPKVYEGRE